MTDAIIPGDHKFPCRWCGRRRVIDPRRRGDHIRCAIKRRLRMGTVEKVEP